MNFFCLLLRLEAPPSLHRLLLRLELGKLEPHVGQLVQEVGPLLGQAFECRRELAPD